MSHKLLKKFMLIIFVRGIELNVVTEEKNNKTSLLIESLNFVLLKIIVDENKFLIFISNSFK